MPMLYPEPSRLILDAYFAVMSRCGITRQLQTHEALVEMLTAEFKHLDLAVRQDILVAYKGVFGLSGEAHFDLLVNQAIVIHVLCVPVIQSTHLRLLAAQLLAGNYPLGVALNFGGLEHEFSWQRRPR
jgi:hypothetical protein